MFVPFFQNDDLLPVNPKTKRLTADTIGGDYRGMAAGFLWTLAGCQVQRDGRNPATVTGDGVIERIELIRMLINPDMVDELAGMLVDVGFWHGPGHSCDRCPPVQPGTWYFHDWRDMKYSPGQTVALNEAKRKELQTREIVAAVWARDCTDPSNPYLANCRYCGNPVKRKDTVSSRRPELDHVDPTKVIGPRNIVVSCNTCNRQKGARTPEQAGMTLLPEPRPTTTSDAAPAGPASPRDDAGRPATGSSRRPTPPVRGEVPGPATPATAPDVTPSRALTGDELGHDRPAAPAVDQTEFGSLRWEFDEVNRARKRLEITTAAPPPDQTSTSRPHTADHAGRAVTGGRAPGQGQGQGDGLGKGTGDSSGSPRPPTPGESRSQSRRRRRRGGKSRSRGGSRSLVSDPPTETPESNLPTPAANPHDAGAAPDDVLIVEGHGSPYFGWRGPPSELGSENYCPTHHLPQPCWKCARER